MKDREGVEQRKERYDHGSVRISLNDTREVVLAWGLKGARGRGVHTRVAPWLLSERRHLIKRSA